MRAKVLFLSSFRLESRRDKVCVMRSHGKAVRDIYSCPVYLEPIYRHLVTKMAPFVESFRSLRIVLSAEFILKVSFCQLYKRNYFCGVT